ncbi:carboxymuconolactone decarboxylase family protein [Streptomyces alfalfae]|uniref:carboxymuconolactone decarboxylase family protein n=1 Tax=Streptomyces alfalfae TaxID=1642299 RepID=UPI001BA52499|nr:carboxymuconolactone decarboxylase family protein [Streptomyces alfalfae]QUI29955.1 carboxymuconolactone decarboxylase family protein [Streptomyces alfalfae]
MSRIPCLDDASMPESLRSLSQGRIINVYRILGNAPRSVTQIARLGAALFAEGSLSAIDRELLILTYGTVFEAEYEWEQHVPISRAVGVTDAQRAAVRGKRYDADVFTPAQRALLGFAAAAAASPLVDEDRFAAVAAHYTEEQLVETLVLAGFYYLLARVCTVLDVEIDAPETDELVRMAQSMHSH